MTIRIIATGEPKKSGKVINDHRFIFSLPQCENFSNASPVVAVISLKEFAQVCENKDLEAYLLQWKDIASPPHR